MIDASAIIPTHRRPALLRQAMLSVFDQESGPSELIVVDDADDSATCAMVDALAKTAPIPVRYVSTGINGVCHSRNLGARASTSEWVAFLDDDDLWEPQFLSRLATGLREERSDFAMSGIVRHESGKPPVVRAQPRGMVPETVLRHTASMTGSNCIIRRDAFFDVGGFDPEMTVFNDWDLLIRLIDAGFSYTVVDDPLAQWRDHTGQRIASPSKRRAQGIDLFLRRYRTRLSPALVRDLSTMALGIHRTHADTPRERLMLTGRLMAAHGVTGSLHRGARRVFGGKPESERNTGLGTV